METKLFDLHNLAEKMASDVVRGELASIALGEGTDDECVWTVSRSEEDENVAVFECEGESHEYNFNNEKDLADGICDFFSEII